MRSTSTARNMPDVIYFDLPKDDYDWILAMNNQGWYLVQRAVTFVSVVYGMTRIAPFSTN